MPKKSKTTPIIKQKIKNVEYSDIMQQKFLDYAMSVITDRALPDVRDGFKPVHRRILYYMDINNYYPSKPYVKCADIVGGTLGKFHPHGM